MTLSQLAVILESTGLDVAYMHFPDDVQVTMPFITYSESASNNFNADNSVYEKGKLVSVDLWSKAKDEISEGLIETAFANNDIVWSSIDTYEEGEYCFRRTYTLSI